MSKNKIIMKIIAAILLVAALSGCGERRLSLTQEDVIAIYENAYLKGQKAALTNSDNWSIDSLQITKLLFP